MEHVSTLCAAGTIGIAATGFALGRPSPPKQRPLTARRRQSLLARRCHSRSNSAAEPRPATAAHPGFPSPSFSQQQPFPQVQAPHPAVNKGLQTEPRTPARKPEERTGLRPRRRTYVGPGITISEGEVTDEALPSPITGRPSSSWLRRLSTITSSLNGSSVSGSRPQSPSITSSTTPFFLSSHPVTSPNKLVKRSTSSHGLPESHPPFTAGPTSLPLLRRPATSHQRSATMRQRSLTDSRVESTPPKLTPNFSIRSGNSAFGINHDGPWRPYFSRTRPTRCSESYGRRRTATSKHRTRSPCRLVSHSSVPPTLLLASSIAPTNRHSNSIVNSDQPRIAKGHQSWNSADLGGDPFAHRPVTRHVPLKPCSSMQDVDSEDLISPWTMPRNAPHRSSFSQDNDCLDLPSIDSARRCKSERLNGGSVQSRRRGNITDPDVFRRPSTSSQIELTAAHFERTATVTEDFTPKARLRHLPNFSNLRCEALNLAAADSGNANLDSKSSPRAPSPPGSPTANSTQPSVDCCLNQRHSAAGSDPASTLVGSDNDIKVFSSGEEDDTDFQSDIAFDSLPTRAAGSNKSVRRGPRIETIFDQSTSITAPKLVSLPAENYPPNIDFASNHSTPLTHSFEGFSDDKQHLLYAEKSSPPAQISFSDTGLDKDASSSSASSSPQTQRLRRTAKLQNIEKSRRDANGLPLSNNRHDNNLSVTVTNSVSASDFHRTTTCSPVSSVAFNENSEKNSHLCLYDWSEQQKIKKDEQGSDPRPRTSHIEQFLDLRGGRTAIRRTSSSLHLRSQSVPLSREPVAPKEPSAKKFATWGLGNKGASEDWDGDFDFGDSERQCQTNPSEKRQDPPSMTQTVKVPQAIMERQESVYGQFSHVQELTVLVEELKLLRARARAMHIIDGPSSELWKEAQGIISLATFEEDEEYEHELRMRRSTSSLTFSLEEFDAELGYAKQSGLSDTVAITDDQFALPKAEHVSCNGRQHLRPRTDSSTKAKYVLDTIHRDRKLRENAFAKQGSDGQHKLAFDTQSLRDLVVRAGVVTRALKDVVRKAEGVCLLPEVDTRTSDPPFSKIFCRPQADSSVVNSHN
ncbi:uncharacterized protein CIMG_04215 [Coccidioides immitis RS]|uniref:Uncharacterized protein n=3 Tax=Coccidioides immitis TaxID=5501 RepID=J3KD17_COCIM|nr:uncharacterized protein CIMG_04215 [Coccidioides immitis RS]EAS33191.3 hypothetical protein CIMG_04215 [Coccidioides immitis RS]KMP08488.1 hypothetical protein CIRG_08169 [Coccidioides immitis RMSCC 2394]